jgi:hypothetical protein
MSAYGIVETELGTNRGQEYSGRCVLGPGIVEQNRTEQNPTRTEE